MKTIGLIVDADMYSHPDTGTTVRIKGIIEALQNIGLRVSPINNYRDAENIDFVYLMLTTKTTSSTYKFIKNFNKREGIIIDLYNPVLLEKQASMSRYNPLDFYKNYKNTNVIKWVIGKGNNFIVANHRQLIYWRNFAKSINISIPQNKFLVIPTGVKKNSSHKFSKNPKVIVMFGGFYPWMNPLPFIDSFSKIAERHKDWKLRFLGAFQPGSGFKKNYDLLVNEAKKKIPRGQLEFIPWQPQEKLGKYFSDVAFAVHIPKDTKEDYYSHRARLLTVLSYGVPVLTSGKDAISSLLIKEKAGEFLPSDPKEIELTLNQAISTYPTKSWRKRTLSIQDKYIKQELDLNLLNVLK